MTRTVMLLTTVDWTATARYAQGFAAASWRVEAFSPAKAPVALSRYVARRHRYRPLRALASLRQALGEARPDLLVVCDDRAVSLLLKLYAREAEGSALRALIARSLGAPEQFETILSRASSMAAAQGGGIRCADTLAIESEAALETGIAAFGLPAVLKSDGSWGGDGVAVVRTKQEALRAFRKLKRPASRLRNLVRALKRKDLHFLLGAWSPSNPAVSLQRFVVGTPSASAFACWKGKVVAHLCYDVLVSDGAMGPPNVIRHVDCPQMRDASERVARRFGLSGVYGLDFIRDGAGDVHLIEINPRTTQGGTLPFGEGRDLPSALAACVAGMPAARRAAIESDIVAFFPNEWQRDAESPYLTQGFHNVPWDDPAVLKSCFDTLPEAKTPERSHAIRSLIRSAPAPEFERLAPVFGYGAGVR